MTPSFDPQHIAAFKAISTVRLPASGWKLARLLMAMMVVLCLALLFTPWVQTSHGQGRFISLNPDDRPQQIQALVEGRIQEWHVLDGQMVEAGAPIATLIDNDPQLLMRLESERNALQQKLEIAGIAARTSELDYARQQKLHRDGLSATREVEQAKIRMKEMMARVNDAQAELNKAEVRLSRLSTQTITAPHRGMVVNLRASGASSFIKAGDVIADILPSNHSPAVEVFVSGLDAPLIQSGQEARLMFEGWPAVQFSGWPAVAVGTFRGRVLTVDAASNPRGQFRVIIVPKSTDDEGAEHRWPSEQYLRFGSRTQGWVLLDTVPLGYELWRKLNGFPPNNPSQPSEMMRP